MVFHCAAIHHHDAVSCIDFCVGSDLSVLQCHHDRGGLEGGARFQHVADGVVAHFVILSVARFHHIDDCLYLSGLHFHQYGDAYIGVDFLQFVYQCLFTNVLHAHVDGGDDVATVYGSDVHYVQVFVHHLLAVGNAVASFQQGVKGKLDAVLCPLCRIGVEVAQCTGCQRTERFFTLVISLLVEAALVFVQVEHRQPLGFFVLDVRDAFGIDQVVAASLFAPFQQVPLEFGGALIREYPVQSLADFTQVVHKHGVFLLTACFEVHVNAVLR